ncbi:UNVERIFIED_CONTAM: ATP synthase subunit d, mitochondrial [Sesamum angustifolium]|uniref:ATP synthase subunit d, mitochondrial n=1 Tax=Sesamum angustifolium TaxID=2727405 RepID=A0AAW2QQP2_9LAMI
MSGAGKKVVDVAFKAGRTIDWEGMAKLLVSDEARKEFATLRRAFDEVNTQLQTKFSQVKTFMFRSLYLSLNDSFESRILHTV